MTAAEKPLQISCAGSADDSNDSKFSFNILFPV